MARAYQDSHITQTLQSDLKALTTTVLALQKSHQKQNEQIAALATQNAALSTQLAQLETRTKANGHNARARIQNLQSYLSAPSKQNVPLAPLYGVMTNRPILHGPKRLNDIKTMAPAEVIQVLQALGISILGIGGAGERKGRLRAEVGVPRDAGA